MLTATVLLGIWGAFDVRYILALKAGYGALYVFASPLVGLAAYIAWINRRKLFVPRESESIGSG